MDEIAYYYPAPYWGADDGSWIKSLLLFFDGVSILLPAYMHGRHAIADPAVAEPLEDAGLLRILDPFDWVDQEMTDQLASIMVELLTTGVFDDLDTDVRFHELSYSRLGYGADVDLSSMLVRDLEERHLARPTQDGLSVPLHPMVRTTVLVLLGQLARSAGHRRGLSLHPATNDGIAVGDMLETLDRGGMPSAGHVVGFDLQAVGLDLGQVPLEDVLEFRVAHGPEFKAYMRSLRGFLAEIAALDDDESRVALFEERREEIRTIGADLQRKSKLALAKNVPSLLLGLFGAGWGLAARDVLSTALSLADLGTEAIPGGGDVVGAYSYLFATDDSLPYATRRRR